jgi:hypothetical protein
MIFHTLNEEHWIYCDETTQEVLWQILLQKEIFKVVKGGSHYKYYLTLEAAKLAILIAQPIKTKPQEPELPWG